MFSMREYSALLTGIISALLTGMLLWSVTDFEVLGVALLACCAFIIAMSLFMTLTEGR